MTKFAIGMAFAGKSSPYAYYNTVEQIQELVKVAQELGPVILDTGRRYPLEGKGQSEELIGETALGGDVLIDTKIVSSFPGSHSRENINICYSESVKALNGKPINVLYLHAPDRSTPLEETLESMDKLYRKRGYRYLGLSNYSPEEVSKIVQICRKNNFVLPSYYQGQYNVLNASKANSKLLPILREHNIAYFAYSPLAGGLFSKSAAKGELKGTARFGQEGTHLTKLYAEAYLKPSVMAAVERIQQESENFGLSTVEVVLRWLVYHSALSSLDGIILGGSKVEHVKASVEYIKRGKLPDHLVRNINNSIKNIGEDAPYAWL